MNEVKLTISYEIQIDACKQRTMCFQQKTNGWYAKKRRIGMVGYICTICKLGRPAMGHK